jgi:hypothetical protein
MSQLLTESQTEALRRDARIEPDPPSPLRAAAFHGLAGELMCDIEPHTEADTAAVLVQFLAAVGNAVGRGPGFRVEADRHHCNLFVGIVGETAVARKGSSWGQASRLVKLADPEWDDRIATGASSGEGMIWQVRDEIKETRKAKKDEEGDEQGFVTELADLGVEDKRLLVIEPELASVLERMGRDGNTLSAVLRQGWDGKKLDTLVKTNRATATDAHLSLVGHITVEELKRKLSATEQANGFANRFLWVYARRSKFLPFGGQIESVDWAPHLKRLELALQYPPTGPLGMDSEASEIWEAEYGALSTVGDGMLGSVTARAASQTRRLAVIYALLDPKPDGGAVVEAPHLLAALEIWRYSRESAAHIFGGRLGDPDADAILTKLKDSEPDGCTRNDLRDLFGRHRTAADLDRALAALAKSGRIREETEQTGGRPATRYHLREKREKREKGSG